MNYFSRLLSEKKRLAVAACLLAVIAAAVVMIVRESSVDLNLESAQEALEQRDFTAASWHLAKYLETHPRDTAARLLAARTARRNGALDQALDHLAIYKKRGGRDAAADLEQRLTRLQAGDLEEANALLEGCKQQPNAAETPLILEAVIEGCLRCAAEAVRDEAANDARQNDVSSAAFERGQRAVELWIAQRPKTVDLVQGFVWQGKLYAVARDFPGAQAAFRRALVLDPEQAVAREYLGLLLVQDAPREAATHLQRLFDRAPENLKVGYGLAIARRSLGELDQAAKVLDGLLARHPDDVSLLVERARVALDEQRTEDAQRWLKRALAIAPDHAQANLAFSDCLKQSGQPDQAKPYHDKFLRASQTLPKR